MNLRGQAGLYSILNFVQDVGWLHANALKIQLPSEHGWVFTRQKLSMNSWPMWNEIVTLRTWLRKPESAFIYRDYEFFVNDIKIGECTSTFTVMNLSTRKLAIQDWNLYDSAWSPSEHLEFIPEKIIWNTDATELTQFQVRNSDIDLNHHVNNTKYAQWILDAIPIDTLRDGAILKGYEVNFLSESKIGDVISLQKVNPEISIDQSKLIQFQGSNLQNGKSVFTARLQVIN